MPPVAAKDPHPVEPTTALPVDAPASTSSFPVVVRGYDREAVDSYIAEMQVWARDVEQSLRRSNETVNQLQDQIVELRQQVAAAESETRPEPHIEAAARSAADGLVAAMRQADAITERATADANAIVSAAHERAEHLLTAAAHALLDLEAAARADRAAAAGSRDEVQQAAQAEAEAIVQEARKKADQIAAEQELRLADLRRQEQDVLGRLQQLRGSLESLVNPGGAP